MKEKARWSKLNTDGLEKVGLTVEDFVKVLDYYFGSIFIANGDGIILFFNEMYYTSFGLSRKEHLGKHVSCLKKEGIFDRSLTLEVIEKKEEVTGIVKDKFGKEIFIRAVPIFDDYGDVFIIVQFAQEKTFIASFLDEIDKSQKQIEAFYGALEYITKSVGDGLQLIYKSDSMAHVCNIAKVIAKTEGTVILYGKSGTGKEVLARYIYQESNRSKEVFIPLNCAAIPSELLESEIFGYAPGAFTGAKKEGKPGLFELANKGTLFLDEIGELPLLLQSKLLRVLETGEVTRLGATASQKVDVRIITATNRDLKAMIKDNTFREDLYYRLNVLPIIIPSLKDRVEDIEVLAEHFLNFFNKKYRLNKRLSEQCLDNLKSYDWPGNVRELKNIIHRLVITTQDDVLHSPACANFNTMNTIYTYQQKEEIHFVGELKAVMHDYEKQYISAVLKECGGNVTEAAEKLGIHRSFIYRKLGK